MPISKNRLDRQHQSHKENPIDGGDDRRVTDIVTHDKLDTIAAGLGTTDTTPIIYNVPVPIANVELSQALPANVKQVIIKSRNKGTIRLAFNSGDTATNYIELKLGNTYKDNNYDSSKTLYFRSSKAGDVIEILAYS